MDKFFITTAIPYVNGRPHIGHALEYFQADVLRRYHQILGEETLLLSGADENALKNVQAAEKEGIEIKEFLNRNSEVFKKSYEQLGVPLDVFQRGSDKENHWPGVQKLWEKCLKNGDIYKKSYKGLYCIGCESFKTEKELVEGKCPDHLKEPEKVTEENYFFKLSNYQNKLLEIIESGELKIEPINRRNEIVSFIKQGLEDFSISRSKERARGVGVPVPADESQVMYVWFDALAIYITGIGFGKNEKQFNKWWPADLHVIGKDINRFHTVYWPAMLLSAGLEIPKAVLVHGFIQSGGQKMSKTIGNVIDPLKIAEKYGLEAFRYYMLSQIPTDNDGDFTEERFKEVYNADLANGLGNLVSRVAKLCETSNIELKAFKENEKDILDKYVLLKKQLEEFRFNDYLKSVFLILTQADEFISQERPWEKTKSKQILEKILYSLVNSLREVSILLKPFLPETSEKILSQFGGNKIKTATPLFPRI